jgi:bacterioferritin (cytochrome b1)
MFDLSQPGLQNLQAFLRSHSEALQNTALLLGGQPALRRAQRLLDDIPEVGALTRRLERELCAIHRLLSLEDVCDFDNIEAAYFAGLDPASPITEEICLLCDTLTDHLDALGLVDQTSDEGFDIAA